MSDSDYTASQIKDLLHHILSCAIARQESMPWPGEKYARARPFVSATSLASALNGVGIPALPCIKQLVPTRHKGGDTISLSSSALKTDPHVDVMGLLFNPTTGAFTSWAEIECSAHFVAVQAEYRATGVSCEWSDACPPLSAVNPQDISDLTEIIRAWQADVQHVAIEKEVDATTAARTAVVKKM